MTRRVIDHPKLVAFMTLFEKWNQRINLSAARTRADLEEHVLDCLNIVPHLSLARTVLDVGSGGGLPVVIAAISCPEISFVALEPVHKKHAFLRTAARELDLVNLETFAMRIEDHDRRDYDAASSRATFDLEEWLSLGLTHVRPGGFVIGFEGIERADLSTPVERHPYELSDKTRAIVIARRDS